MENLRMGVRVRVGVRCRGVVRITSVRYRGCGIDVGNAEGVVGVVEEIEVSVVRIESSGGTTSRGDSVGSGHVPALGWGEAC